MASESIGLERQRTRLRYDALCPRQNNDDKSYGGHKSDAIGKVAKQHHLHRFPASDTSNSPEGLPALKPLRELDVRNSIGRTPLYLHGSISEASESAQ